MACTQLRRVRPQLLLVLVQLWCAHAAGSRQPHQEEQNGRRTPESCSEGEAMVGAASGSALDDAADALLQLKQDTAVLNSHQCRALLRTMRARVAKGSGGGPRKMIPTGVLHAVPRISCAQCGIVTHINLF